MSVDRPPSRGQGDEFFSEDRTRGRAGGVDLPSGDFRDHLQDPQDPLVAQYRGQRYDDYSADRTAPSFVQELLGDWERLYREPFRGVTSDGDVDLTVWDAPDGPPRDQEARAAAQRVLDVLDPAQGNAFRHSVDAQEWRAWSNPEFVIHRVGLRLEDLGEEQVDAFLALVAASLSPEGNDRVRELMRLNGFLGELVDLPTVMNERSYFVSLYGEPAGDQPWGWQLFGHHVAVNFVSVGDRQVVAPLFLGAEPAVLDDDRPGVFADREDTALALVQSLTDAQRRVAVVYASVLDPSMPPDRLHPADERHVAGAFRDNRVVPHEGLRADAMDPAQRRLLEGILADALLLLREPHRHRLLTQVLARLDETWFSWYGATDGSQPFYFRVHSPVVLAELDHHAGVWLSNQLPARFHVHTTLRLPNGNDYGRAYLAALG